MTEERKREIENEFIEIAQHIKELVDELGYSITIHANEYGYSASVFPFDGCVSAVNGKINGLLDFTKEDAWSYMSEEDKKVLRKKNEGEEE